MFIEVKTQNKNCMLIHELKKDCIMKPFYFYLLALVMLLGLPTLANSQVSESSPAQIQRLVGVWQGALKIQSMELRIVFKISEKPDGTLTSTMDSPDQGAKDIPTDSTVSQDGNLHIIMANIGGRYEGTMQAGDSVIDGTWSQSGATFPLQLRRSVKPIEVNRPQEPKPPYPYNVEDVLYVNTEEGDTLAGTLTTPKSGSPFPAVLLITGSGRQNRDEEIFGHKPFLVLADYLTRRGIAVLRVDDRGVGKSTGDFNTATTQDFAADALAGVEFLKSRKEVDPTKIGLIGHSEGGVIAPMVAAEHPEDISFIVMMAGTGLPGEKILLLQDSLISKANGEPDSTIDRDLRVSRKLYNTIKEEPDTTIAKEKLRSILVAARSALSDSEKSALPDTMIGVQIRTLTSRWFRYFLMYDPRPTLMKVQCPVLAINGEKDLQVPAKQNLRAIEKALTEGGNTHVTVKELPGLNHLFQTAQTGSPLEYSKIEETMSPTALKVIVGTICAAEWTGDSSFDYQWLNLVYCQRRCLAILGFDEHPHREERYLLVTGFYARLRIRWERKDDGAHEALPANPTFGQHPQQLAA
jgi:pimeloyl-ACP methyl ester carboxylesterase